MDWDKLAAGEIICSACRFCFDDLNPALAAKIGKPKQRMRNYSHFVLNGEWTPLSKGRKPHMLALLAQSPEVAVVADSGQKHIIFRARRGWWQFEEQVISPDLLTLHIIHGLAEELYLGGISKAEIETARYNPWRALQFGPERWMDIEARLKPHRGSALFSLALFLTTKPDDKKEDDDERTDREGDDLSLLAGHP